MFLRLTEGHWRFCLLCGGGYKGSGSPLPLVTSQSICSIDRVTNGIKYFGFEFRMWYLVVERLSSLHSCTGRSVLSFGLVFRAVSVLVTGFLLIHQNVTDPLVWHVWLKVRMENDKQLH